MSVCVCGVQFFSAIFNILFLRVIVVLAIDFNCSSNGSFAGLFNSLFWAPHGVREHCFLTVDFMLVDVDFVVIT